MAPTKKPVQSETPDAITDLRRELEGKGAWALGILIVVLIAVFGFFAYWICGVVDKYGDLRDKVVESQTNIRNITEQLHNKADKKSN